MEANAGVEAGVAPRKRSVGRRLAGLFHGRPRLQVGALLAGPIGWLVIGYLGSLVVILVAAFWQVERAQRRGRADVQPRQLPDPGRGAGLPHDRRPHDPDRGAGDDHRRPARLPDRLLHGEGRQQPDEGAARRRRAAAAVVELPGQGLRLADDPLQRRDPQLGARPARDRRARLRQRRRLAGDELPLAAVHDHPDLRRAGADPGLGDQRLRGPRAHRRSRPSGG